MNPQLNLKRLREEAGFIECYYVREHPLGYTAGIWVVWIENAVVYSATLKMFVSHWMRRLELLQTMRERMLANDLSGLGISDSDDEDARPLGIDESKLTDQLTPQEMKRKEIALGENARFAEKAQRIITWSEQLNAMHPQRQLRLRTFDAPRRTPDKVIERHLGVHETFAEALSWRRAEPGYLPSIAGEIIGLPEPKSEPLLKAEIPLAQPKGPARRLRLSPNAIEVLNKKIVNAVEEFIDLGRGTLQQAYTHVAERSKEELGHELSAKAIEGRYIRNKKKYT
jgi:hypothetical protein